MFLNRPGNIGSRVPHDFFPLTAVTVGSAPSCTDPRLAGLPGNLEASDWTLILEVLGAVKRGLPDAGVRPPGQVMSFVLDASETFSRSKSALASA